MEGGSKVEGERGREGSVGGMQGRVMGGERHVSTYQRNV